MRRRQRKKVVWTDRSVENEYAENSAVTAYPSLYGFAVTSKFHKFHQSHEADTLPGSLWILPQESEFHFSEYDSAQACAAKAKHGYVVCLQQVWPNGNVVISQNDTLICLGNVRIPELTTNGKVVQRLYPAFLTADGLKVIVPAVGLLRRIA